MGKLTEPARSSLVAGNISSALSTQTIRSRANGRQEVIKMETTNTRVNRPKENTHNRKHRNREVIGKTKRIISSPLAERKSRLLTRKQSESSNWISLKRLLFAPTLLAISMAVVACLLLPVVQSKIHHSKRQATNEELGMGSGGSQMSVSPDSNNWWNLWWQQYITDTVQPTVRPIIAVHYDGQTIRGGELTSGYDLRRSAEDEAASFGSSSLGEDLSNQADFTDQTDRQSAWRNQPSPIWRNNRQTMQLIAASNKQPEQPNEGIQMRMRPQQPEVEFMRRTVRPIQQQQQQQQQQLDQESYDQQQHMQIQQQLNQMVDYVDEDEQQVMQGGGNEQTSSSSTSGSNKPTEEGEQMRTGNEGGQDQNPIRDSSSSSMMMEDREPTTNRVASSTQLPPIRSTSTQKSTETPGQPMTTTTTIRIRSTTKAPPTTFSSTSRPTSATQTTTTQSTPPSTTAITTTFREETTTKSERPEMEIGRTETPIEIGGDAIERPTTSLPTTISKSTNRTQTRTTPLATTTTTTTTINRLATTPAGSGRVELENGRPASTRGSTINITRRPGQRPTTVSMTMSVATGSGSTRTTTMAPPSTTASTTTTTTTKMSVSGMATTKQPPVGGAGEKATGSGVENQSNASTPETTTSEGESEESGTEDDENESGDSNLMNSSGSGETEIEGGNEEGADDDEEGTTDSEVSSPTTTNVGLTSTGTTTGRPSTPTTQTPAMTTIEIERMSSTGNSGSSETRGEASTALPMGSTESQTPSKSGQTNAKLENGAQQGGKTFGTPTMEGETAITVPMDGLMRMMMANLQTSTESDTQTTTLAPLGSTTPVGRKKLQPPPSTTVAAAPTTQPPSPLQTTTSTTTEAARTTNASTTPSSMLPSTPRAQTSVSGAPGTSINARPSAPGSDEVSISSPDGGTTPNRKGNVRIESPASATTTTTTSASSMTSDVMAMTVSSAAGTAVDEGDSSGMPMMSTMMAGGEPRIELINLDLMPIQRVMNGAGYEPNTGINSQFTPGRAQPIPATVSGNKGISGQTPVEPGMRLRPLPVSSMGGQQQTGPTYTIMMPTAHSKKPGQMQTMSQLTNDNQAQRNKLPKPVQTPTGPLPAGRPPAQSPLSSSTPSAGQKSTGRVTGGGSTTPARKEGPQRLTIGQRGSSSATTPSMMSSQTRVGFSTENPTAATTTTTTSGRGQRPESSSNPQQVNNVGQSTSSAPPTIRPSNSGQQQQQQQQTTTTSTPTTGGQGQPASKSASSSTTVQGSSLLPTVSVTSGSTTTTTTTTTLSTPTRANLVNNEATLSGSMPTSGEPSTKSSSPTQQGPQSTKTPTKTLTKTGNASKTGPANQTASAFIPARLRGEFQGLKPATSGGNQLAGSSNQDGAAIRQFGGSNRMSVLANKPVPFGRPSAGSGRVGAKLMVNQPPPPPPPPPTFEYGAAISVRRPDEPLAPGQQAPNCTLTGKNFCLLTKDYPMNEVRQAVERSFRSVRIMYEELQTVSDQELHREDFANATSSQAASGKFACQTQVELMRPGWAKDEITKEWMLVVNTDVFPQRVRSESCAQPNTPCEFIAPFYDSTCQQRYSLHRMIAIDPHDPTRSPQVAVFKFPAGCVCRVHPIRKTPAMMMSAVANSAPPQTPLTTARASQSGSTTTTTSAPTTTTLEPIKNSSTNATSVNSTR